MVIVEFNDEGLIKNYIYDIAGIELNKNTILLSDDSYSELVDWYKQEELQYLFNAEEYKILDKELLNTCFVKYEREFIPPFVTDKERIKQLEQENEQLKLTSANLISMNWDVEYRVSEIEWLLELAKGGE